jgi:lipoprotein-releasing system permease protein
LNFPLFIAKRYLFSKKSHNAINIISIVSSIGVGIGTFALVVVLSVFNGFEGLIVSLFNSFDSDLKITALEGKTFDVSDTTTFNRLKNIPGIKYYSEVLEENALLKYNDAQFIATIKGVQADYIKNSGLDSMLTDGALPNNDTSNYALIGQGVANMLGVNIAAFYTPVVIYLPKGGKSVNLSNPEDAFTINSILPSASFSVQQEIDIKYVLVPLFFAREIMDKNNKASSIEIGLKTDVNASLVKDEIQKIVGDKFVIQNRFEQHEFLFKIMKSEKWAVFLILAFILIVATFNVIGSISMLILDKQKDIIVLKSLGASHADLRTIFMAEGFLITFLGAISGLVLGILLCLGQQRFGWIKLNGGGGNFVVEAYPVDLQFIDLSYILLTVLVIGYFAARYPAVSLINKTNLAKTRVQ